MAICMTTPWSLIVAACDGVDLLISRSKVFFFLQFLFLFLMDKPVLLRNAFVAGTEGIFLFYYFDGFRVSELFSYFFWFLISRAWFKEARQWMDRKIRDHLERRQWKVRIIRCPCGGFLPFEGSGCKEACKEVSLDSCRFQDTRSSEKWYVIAFPLRSCWVKVCSQLMYCWG